MGSKISALSSAANLLGSTKKLGLANVGFVVPDGWSSGVAVPLTGSTSETVLATIAIPAGAMGANGILRITTVWRAGANNANAKTGRVRLGASGAGTGGTSFGSWSLASLLTGRFQCQIHNQNSQSAQGAMNNGAFGFATSTSDVTTGAIDTSAASEIAITGQLGVGTDTLSLYQYVVEILYKA